MSKMVRFLLVISVLGLGLYGCGGGDDSTPASTPTGVAAVSTAQLDTSKTSTTSVTADATGVLGAATISASSSTSQTKVSAVLTGVKATTATGQPAQGQVTFTAKVSDYTSEKSFPGATFTTGTNQWAAAGFFDITAQDANGNYISQFTPAINFTMTIPAGTFKPGTTTPIVAGDVLDLWNTKIADDGTVTWVQDANQKTVTVSASNTVTFAVSHFTGYLAGKQIPVTIVISDINVVKDDTAKILTLSVKSPASNVSYSWKSILQSTVFNGQTGTTISIPYSKLPSTAFDVTLYQNALFKSISVTVNTGLTGT